MVARPSRWNTAGWSRFFSGLAKLTGLKVPATFHGSVGSVSPVSRRAGIDTRSDIYSLGVLLYELLTGTTPFEQERLRQAGLDEVRRIMREDRSRGAAELIDTLSAPALSSVRISSIVRIPLPAHSGMNTTSAVRRTTSIMIPRLSWLAVISRNTSSSAPSRSYRSATSTGSPASRSWTKFVPLTTRPRSTSRHGMIRFASTAGSLLVGNDRAPMGFNLRHAE